MKITRANLLRGALASTALLPAAAFAASGGAGAFRSGAASGVPQAGNGPLRFAVIGDNTGISRPGVFKQAMIQLSWLQPDFVLSVGDLIEGYTSDKAKIASQWNAIEEAVAGLGRPFVYVPGNHDLNSKESVDAWHKRRGATYYSFTYKGALFLVLNTEDPPIQMPPQMSEQFYMAVDLMQSDPEKAERLVAAQIDALTSRKSLPPESLAMAATNMGAKQLEWVRETLARHPNPKWTFVVMHKPVWKAPADWGPELRASGLLPETVSPNFAKLRTLLAGRPYTVFAGHTHYYTHDVIDGRDYINMATTGGIRQHNGPGTLDHTMIVTLTDDGPVYANERFTGLMNIDGQTGQVLTY